MVGKYRFTSEGELEFKARLRRKSTPILLFVLTPFLIAPFIIQQLFDFGYLIALVAVILLGLLGSFIGTNIYSDTTIEIQADRVIRYGKKLARAELKFEEIGEIEIRKEGARIFKKDFQKWKLNWGGERMPLVSRIDLVFIPYGIENFELIIEYISQRKKYFKSK